MLSLFRRFRPMPTPPPAVESAALAVLHSELTDHFLTARKQTTSEKEAIAQFIKKLQSEGYPQHFPKNVLATAIDRAITEVEVNLQNPEYHHWIGSQAPQAKTPQTPVLQTPNTQTPSTSAAPIVKTISLQAKMLAAKTPQERGDVFAEAISRCRGISPDKFCCVGIATGNPRVSVYKMQQVDVNGTTIFRGAKGFEDLAEHFKVLGLSGGNRKVAIVPREGYIAIEVPNPTWEPVLLDSLIKQGSEPIPGSPLTAWIGINTEGETVEFDFSKPTGCHLSLAGMTGGGKTAFINTLVVGMIVRHRSPWFVKFVIIDIQQVNAQHLESFLPWFWKDLGVLSKSADISTVLRFVEDIEEGDSSDSKPHSTPGLLQIECKRREDLFLVARSNDLDSYNRVAYEDYLSWRDQQMNSGAVIKSLTIDAYNKAVDPDFDRWRHSAEFQKWRQSSASSRKGKPRPYLPILEHIVVLLDEASGTKDLFGGRKKQFTQWLRQISQELRKFGVHLFGCTQRPSADSYGPYDSATREQFGYRVCLKVMGESTSEMALGKTHKIGTELGEMGDSYIITPDNPEPMRVQILFTPHWLIDSLSQQVMQSYGERPMRTINQVHEQLMSREGAPIDNLFGSLPNPQFSNQRTAAFPAVAPATLVKPVPRSRSVSPPPTEAIAPVDPEFESIYDKVIQVRKDKIQEINGGSIKKLTETELGIRVFGDQYRGSSQRLKPQLLEAIAHYEGAFSVWGPKHEE